MSEFRYPQFCPLARAAEVLGERWTLLILRELLLRPVRFSELKRRLFRVSPSVLSTRVQVLEARGIVTRRELPAPASATVIELTELGRSLQPVLEALTRFGLQIIGLPEPGDHFEPSWLRMGIPATVQGRPTPAKRIALTIRDPEGDFSLAIVGSPDGARVEQVDPGELAELGDVDLTLRGDGLAVMGVAVYGADASDAEASGALEVEGDRALLACLPEFFLPGEVVPSNAHSPGGPHAPRSALNP